MKIIIHCASLILLICTGLPRGFAWGGGGASAITDLTDPYQCKPAAIHLQFSITTPPPRRPARIMAGNEAAPGAERHGKDGHGWPWPVTAAVTRGKELCGSLADYGVIAMWELGIAFPDMSYSTWIDLLFFPSTIFIGALRVR